MTFKAWNRGLLARAITPRVREHPSLVAFCCTAIAALLAAAVFLGLHLTHPFQPPPIKFKADDPDSIIAEADRLLWLMNFPAAAPLYTRAERLFHDRGDQRGEAYARVGRLAAQTDSTPRSQTSKDLERELGTLLARSDPKFRLRCLVAKGYADLEYDPASAQKLWIEVIEDARKAHDHMLATRAEGELAILALLLDGDRAKAVSMFGHAFLTTIVRRDVAGQVGLLGILGNGLNEMHRYTEALVFFERAIKLARLNPDVGFPFLSYEGKAEALLAQGQTADSAEILSQALLLSESQRNGTEESAVRVLLGRLDQRTGDTILAIHEFQNASQIATRLCLYRMVADANYELAKIYTANGSMPEARASLQLAVTASHHLRDIYFPPKQFSEMALLDSKLGRIHQANNLYTRAEDSLDQMLHDPCGSSYWQTGLREALSDAYVRHFRLLAGRNNVPAAFHVIERIRGRAIAASLGLPSDGDRCSDSKGIQEKIAAVQLQLIGGSQAPNRTQLLETLSVLEEQLASSRYAGVPSGNKSLTNPATLREVQRDLRDDEIVLEYVLDEPVTFAFVITRTQARIVSLPVGRAAIETLTDTFMSRVRARELASDSARYLYSVLLKPLGLPAGKTRLIIVPDGKLHFLPFEALAGPPDDFLIRSYIVSYSPSATLLPALRSSRRNRPRAQRALLAVGDVQYEKAPIFNVWQLTPLSLRGLSELFDARLSNLPKSRDEVLAVSRALKADNAILLGQSATEAAFKAEPLNQFKVLHLAVHAVADADFPDRAALVLGTDGSSGEDGLLQAREIMKLPLNADLVTLSACDTAIGKLEGEEGISNLEQAFLVAGAHAVVASLWKADDSVTTVLMKHFYRRLTEGMDKAEALREAKLDLLRKYGSHTPPFYWAGFILSGEGSSPISPM